MIVCCEGFRLEGLGRRGSTWWRSRSRVETMGISGLGLVMLARRDVKIPPLGVSGRGGAGSGAGASAEGPGSGLELVLPLSRRGRAESRLVRGRLNFLASLVVGGEFESCSSWSEAWKTSSSPSPSRRRRLFSLSPSRSIRSASSIILQLSSSSLVILLCRCGKTSLGRAFCIAQAFSLLSNPFSPGAA